MRDDGLNDGDSNNDEALDRGLAADLAALRSALRDVRSSDADERNLIAALRARSAASFVPTPAAAGGAQRAARGHAWRAPFALAAAAALAVVTAVLTLGVERGDDTLPPASIDTGALPAAAPAPAASQSSLGAFQPLAFSPGLSPSLSYSVVRVRIPLAALTPGHVAPSDATIEADLLVGEDGIASGIRFNREDTLFVSAASNWMGERR